MYDFIFCAVKPFDFAKSKYEHTFALLSLISYETTKQLWTKNPSSYIEGWDLQLLLIKTLLF